MSDLCVSAYLYIAAYFATKPSASAASAIGHVLDETTEARSVDLNEALGKIDDAR
jgi:hypothetical protein